MDEGLEEAPERVLRIKRAPKQGSPYPLTSACSAPMKCRLDCVKKRDPRRDASKDGIA